MSTVTYVHKEHKRRLSADKPCSDEQAPTIKLYHNKMLMIASLNLLSSSFSTLQIPRFDGKAIKAMHLSDTLTNKLIK